MKKIIIGLAVLALSACSSLQSDWDYDPSAQFGQYKTYAWVPEQANGAGYQLDGLMDQRVRNAVNSQLSAKGISLVDGKDADLLVNYLTKIDKKINVDTFNTHFGYNPYYAPSWRWGGSMQTQTTVREYEVGTLIIDLIDSKTAKLIWRGSVADTIRDKSTPEQKVQMINEAVAKVMANYPPKPNRP
ncbi:MAG: DUF4136 domain-containing protein [Shewanella sp.]